MNHERSTPNKPLAASEAHEDTVLDWARNAGAAELLVRGLGRYLQRRRRRRRVVAATGCVALLAVASAIWLPWGETVSPVPARVSMTVASASVLRPERRVLPDGSRVELNAGAEIETAFTDSVRRVVLRKGEAHFQVLKDERRPFIVIAGGIEVRAVGTAFAVDLGASVVDVLVTEGRVAVDTAASPATTAQSSGTSSVPPLAALGPGGRAVIDRETTAAGHATPRVSELSAVELQARLAWRVPRLKFAATPLAQVIAMFNAHAVAGRDARLVLAPGTPADLHVSGTLRADDVESLLRLLAGEFGISAETRGTEIVLHRK